MTKTLEELTADVDRLQRVIFAVAAKQPVFFDQNGNLDAAPIGSLVQTLGHVEHAVSTGQH